MTNKTKVTGASLGIVGGSLTFIGYWLTTGKTPPVEAWIALATAISTGVGFLINALGKGES